MGLDCIEHEVEFRLTANGKLPKTIPCVECFCDMRRLLTRKGVYLCSGCGSRTTLDAEDLERLKLS